MTSVATEPPVGMTLGIGNYGMPAATTEEAIRRVAGLGFDSIELAMMPEWDSSPAKLSPARRGAVKRLLSDNGVTLTALMEDIPPSTVEAEHTASLDRLKRAAELGRNLAPERTPLIQTVLGGGKWDDKKGIYRDRVGDWLRIAESNRFVIAVKPHRSGAMSQPAEALWLFEQLGRSPSLGMVYDYSHYAFRDLSIADTVQESLPLTVHVAVKDVSLKDGRAEFALPGETGSIDYVEILRRFYERGYRADVSCEVSSQVFRRSGYDAVAAATTCYNHMSRAFEKSGIPRRHGK